ncbi:peroxidase 31-like [Impatiens glandulifera]|uniref:peroxidase 31-like n=1 Tax=Impatiens glandulifera TaxID=253017 RepID=UPI001FB198FA|nr:peroxidase 31-like [Impatiens glandulifera]
MAPPNSHGLLLSFFAITILFSFPTAESNLDVHYYQTTCPRYNDIVGEVVTERQITNPTIAAATLRLFFHDCLVHGCDASILIDASTLPPNSDTPERDHDINQSLSHESFDLIERIKTALELECPNIVSCADIMATATRNLVTMVGGPLYEVSLGRKDGLISKASEVESFIPRGNASTPSLIAALEAKSLTIQDLVALSGAHTIGFSHCDQFAHRIYNFSSNDEIDPAFNTKYVAGLRQLCINYTNDPTIAAFNDVMTPKKFDNMYFSNLLNGLGLLTTDQGLVDDPKTKIFVEKYAADQTAFFDDFANAMAKLSVLEVKTGDEGEIREKCNTFNTRIIAKLSKSSSSVGVKFTMMNN